jgi:hypothetical protein
MTNEVTTGEGLEMVARAIQRLGNADAGTPMGGLEALGAVIKEAGESISGALHELAEAIKDQKA